MNNLPPFQFVMKSFRFQVFTLQCFLSFSNRAVSKSCCFQNRLHLMVVPKRFSVNGRPKRHDFAPFPFENGIVYRMSQKKVPTFENS